MSDILEPIPISNNWLTDEGKKQLADKGVHVYEIYAFQRRDKTRVIQLANILRNAISINLGKLYEIDSDLAIELKRLLSAACYLFNSTSFREGKYFEFDKIEVDNKIGRKNDSRT